MINDTNDFNKFFRNINRGFKFIICVWVVGVLIGLSLLSGTIYIGLHFIGKVW